MTETKKAKAAEPETPEPKADPAPAGPSPMAVPTITFAGDPKAPGQDPASVTMRGVTFPLGKPVAVEDPALIAKLAKNSHFRVGK